MLGSMTKDKLLELLFLHIKNLWRVDGLYFLGIEKNSGTEIAAQIDANCWRIMGKLEARELKATLKTRKEDVAALIRTLRNTSWALYQTEKESEASSSRGLFRVTRCRTQETRIDKGLGEFPCRKVRFSYLQSFAEEFNPNIKVVCKKCPPCKHNDKVWCEWEFTLRK